MKKNVMAIALLASTGLFVGCAQNTHPDTFSNRKSEVDQKDMRTTPPANPDSIVEQPPAKAGAHTNRGNTGPEVNRKDNTLLAPPDTAVDPTKQEAFKNRQNKVNPLQ